MGKREYLVFLGLVFELVTLVVAFIYAGHQIDMHYGFTGIGVTAGAVLALVIWVYHLYVSFKNIK